MPTQERQEKALEALRQVGLENYAHAYPDELSGGMRQRVGLARALAINPDILLMDEAFSALDPLIRTEMQDELTKLQARHQRTVVFISHDLDEAMRIGDRIAIMQNGEVVQVGTPDEILNNPTNDYVRTFFRGVDISQVFSAKDIARRSPVGLIRKTPGFGPRSALKLLQDEDREYGYVIERGNKFVGIVSIDSLKAALSEGQGIDAALIDSPQAVDAQTPLSELLSHVVPCTVRGAGCRRGAPVHRHHFQTDAAAGFRSRGGKQWLINLTRGTPHRRRIAQRNPPMPGAPLRRRRPMAEVPTG